MANHTITIDPLNPKSIQDAMRQYNLTRKEFTVKLQEFIRRLAEVAQQTAIAKYDSKAISVEVIPMGKNGYQIRASGEGIAFLEFGAGDATNSSNLFADQMPFDVNPGSYSRSGKGTGQYEYLGKWEFPAGSGNWYTAVAPRNAMQGAYEAVIRQMYQIAKEVFK